VLTAKAKLGTILPLIEMLKANKKYNKNLNEGGLPT
jgi:hypothetical protein